jgi:hypothetical protein
MKSLVFTEYEKCHCGIGYLLPTTDPSYLQCPYCHRRKIVNGFQECLKFDDSYDTRR